MTIQKKTYDKPSVQELTLEDQLTCKQCGKTFVRDDLLFVGPWPGVPKVKRPDGLLRPCDACGGREFEVSKEKKKTVG